MPQRHTKNNGSATYGVFSYRERKQCAFMQKMEERLGVDAQLPFGYCCLALQPAIDPVVTPSGHVYSREQILEHLVTKTAELTRKRAQWASEERFANQESSAKRSRGDVAALKAFEKANDPLAIQDAKPAARARVAAGVAKYGGQDLGAKSSSSASTLALYKGGNQHALVTTETTSAVVFEACDEEAEVAERKRAIAQLSQPINRLMEKGTQDGSLQDVLARTSHWLPQFTPVAEKERIPEPPKRPPSPLTGQPLRSKDLIPLELRSNQSAKASSAGSCDDLRYLCHVSGDEIHSQPVVLIRTTGCLVIEAIAHQLGVFQSMICPITSRKFTKKDVVRLVHANSAYAASGGKALKVKVDRAVGGGA